LFNYYLQPAEVKYSRLHDGMPFYTKEYQFTIIYAFHVLQTAYIVAMLYLVRNYHKQIKESYSNFDDSQIMVLYLIPSAGLLIRILQGSFIVFHTDIWMHIDYILVIYAALIIYIGYRQPKVYLQPVDLSQKSKKKVSDQTIIERLAQLIETEKIYKDPKISLTDLALKLDVNPRKLSTFLNTQLNLSFFNYINSLRIEEAKKMLSDNQSDKNVLEILYEVGFNNKSAFNRVFKESTGLTPTEYRQQNIN
jgi:AraC-like DNA-binding protein